MKKVIAISLLILLLVFTGKAVIGESSTTETFYGTQEVSLSVSKHDEKRVLTFPEKPLEFVSKIDWKVSFTRQGLFTNKKASIKIEVVNTDGKAATITSLNIEQKESGELTLQPGQICRLTLYAGKYNTILKKYGSKLEAHCQYQKSQAIVIVTEMNSPGRYRLAVSSIPAASWNWTMPDGSRVTNNTFETVFPAGSAVLQLTNPNNADTFQFDLLVPEAVETNPSVSPLEGYEDLTVRCFANLINHYQSSSKCSWDFGDGTPVDPNEQTEHTYKKPGVYQIKLKIINSLGLTIEKAWDIRVQPFAIKNAAVVKPEIGAIPLTVSYKADPVILGTEPTSIKYLWDFGDGSTSESLSGEHVYQKVGSYPIRLTIVDTNHLNLKMEPWTCMVTVTPPVLTLTADASRRSGTIPLRIRFQSNLEIEGGPTEVEYYWDFNDGTYSSDANPFHTFTDPGFYEVRLTVTDLIYGTTVTERLPVHVKPPKLSLKVMASQYSGIIPAKVTFTPVLDIDGGPTDIEYKWDFNDGTYDKTFTSAPVSHTFSQPGLYTVSVTARDRNYHTADTSQIKIEVKSPIIKSISTITPITGVAPLQLIGLGSASVQGYPTRLEYSWYIDGQRYSIDQEFRYLFTKPGNYKVTVTINDTLPGHTGRDSQSWNVVVNSNPNSTTVIENTPTPPVIPTPPPVVVTPSPTPVQVKDTQPPQLTVTFSPNKLETANHKMIQVSANIQVSDNLDPDPEIRLVSITCNQSFDPNVDISGASFGEDDRSFFLRAETDRKKEGDRIYTVTYSAKDSTGNSTTVTGKVIVPHNTSDEKEDRDNKNGKYGKHKN